MRHLKPLPSGSGRKKKKPYYLLDHMHFLTPYVKPMNPPEAGNLASTSLGNTSDVSNDLPDDVPTEPKQPTERCDIEPSPSTKSQTSTDPVMSFLNSLAPELREMNLQQFKMFKRRVLSLIDVILNPSSTTSESAATGQFITLSNETSHQTV